MLSQRTHMYARIDFISSSDIPPSELAGLLLFLNKIEYFFQAAIHYQNWHKLKSLLTAACGVSSVIKQHKCRCKQMVLVLTFGSPVRLEPTTLRLTAACSTDWAKEEYIHIYIYSLARKFMQMSNKVCERPCLRDAGADLFSQAVSSQVSSTQVSLTSVFGMGTGGTSPPYAPTIQDSILKTKQWKVTLWEP